MSDTKEIPAHHKPNVPAMVRRAAEQAEAAYAATQLPPGEEQDPASAPDNVAPEPAASAVSPVAPPQQAEPPAPSSDTVDWKHRFDSLKGKHDQTMAQVGSMQSEIDNLHRVLAGMQAAQPAPGVQAQPGQPLPADLGFTPITEEERADYGEEFISVAERAAMAKLNPTIQQLRDEITQLRQGVSTVTATAAQNAQTRAYDHLTTEVPDWQQLDVDPNFLAWLDQYDPFSGEKRQTLLNNALAQNNGPRIAYFFKAFKETLAAPAAPPPPPAPARSRTSLETFAAPGRGRPGTASSAPATTGNESVFSQTEIARFYEDVRKGVFRDNPAAKARIEADIFAATAAGRITAG